MAKLFIGCDNASVAYKNTVVKLLQDEGYEVEDLGVDDTADDTYYPYVAQRVCRKVQEEPVENRGILLCGTGIGMCISANKCKDIRAAVVHDIFSCERSRLSNDCNVMCMGSRVIGIETAKTLVKIWLGLGHAQPSSVPKVGAIKEIEGENFK